MIEILTQIQKKQKYLVFLLLGIVLIIAFIWARELIKKVKISSLTEVKVSEVRKVEIDFGILENPMLKLLKNFEKIKPFEREIGRENPFQPPLP